MEMYVTIILSLISAGVTLFVYYKIRNTPLSKERLEKLYVPLFNMLEHDLFNYVHSIETDDKKIQEAFRYMKDNLALADSKLIELFYLFMNERDPAKKKTYFDDVSNRIVTMTSRLSRKIGNGGFSPAFLFNQNLYIKKKMSLFEIEFVLQFYVLPIMVYLIMAFLFLCLFQLFPMH